MNVLQSVQIPFSFIYFSTEHLQRKNKYYQQKVNYSKISNISAQPELCVVSGHDSVLLLIVFSFCPFLGKKCFGVPFPLPAFWFFPQDCAFVCNFPKFSALCVSLPIYLIKLEKMKTTSPSQMSQ